MDTRTAPSVERDGKPDKDDCRDAPKPSSDGTPAKKKSAGGWSWKPILLLAVVLAVIGGLFVAGLLPRLRAKGDAAQAAEPDGPPPVNVVPAVAAPADEAVALPGSTRAFEETAVLARTSGYLGKWHVEMGDRVKADQLMAVIATPELDRELDQSRATLKQTKAALEQSKATLQRNQADRDVARANFDRSRKLIDGKSVSQQEYDANEGAFKTNEATVASGQANVQVAGANVEAAEAAVRRLEQLQSFQQVKAPFAGVVTARNVDTGALIAAGQMSGADPAGGTQATAGGQPATGGGQPAARELFRVARTDTLRVYVYVPQAFTPLVKVGMAAELAVKERAGRTFAAKVTRTANALDPTTRTLLTEVQVPNPEAVLLPGEYATVKFVGRRERPAVIVPGGALLTRPDHMVVAVIGEGDKVRYKRVEVSRDFGGTVELSAGLAGGERVAVNLSDEHPEGTVVRPVPVPDQPEGKK